MSRIIQIDLYKYGLFVVVFFLLLSFTFMYQFGRKKKQTMRLSIIGKLRGFFLRKLNEPDVGWSSGQFQTIVQYTVPIMFKAKEQKDISNKIKKARLPRRY